MMADTVGQIASSAASAPPKKKKRVLAFLQNRPAKVVPDSIFDEDFDEAKKKKEEDDNDDGLDLFRRSDKFFSVAVEEYEERLKTKAEHIEDRRKSESMEERKLLNMDRYDANRASAKRRKLSTDEKMDNWLADVDLYNTTPPRGQPKSPSPVVETTNTTSTPSRSRSKGKGNEVIPVVQSDVLLTPSRSTSRQPGTPAAVITLNDDLEEPSPKRRAGSSSRATKQRSSHINAKHSSPVILIDEDDPFDAAPEEPEKEEEDDEFAHFVKRARERDAATKAATAAAGAAVRASNVMTPDFRQRTTGENFGNSKAVIKIFIHSRLSRGPELKPIGAKRGLHQKLKAVRDVFVSTARQAGVKLSREEEDGIFLTWKGLKLYDSTTGWDQGWRVTADGRVFTPATSNRDEGFEKGGIMLEAWTEQDYADHLAAEERQRRLDRGELEEEDPEENIIEEEVLSAEAKIKVIMKAKDQEPVKTTAYSHTPVSILIAAYRKQRSIPESKEICLRNEGDWLLDVNQTVEDAEIEDMCTVEVYIK